MSVKSTPWMWTGGYPQRITNPAAVLIAEVYEDPDSPPEVAPLICAAVNAYLEPSRRRRWLMRWRSRKAVRLHRRLVRAADNRVKR